MAAAHCQVAVEPTPVQTPMWGAIGMRCASHRWLILTVFVIPQHTMSG
jgi:hypothetical protein